jgi:hypothetical protein
MDLHAHPRVGDDDPVDEHILGTEHPKMGCCDDLVTVRKHQARHIHVT